MASTPIYSYSDVTPAIEALAARSLQNSCIDPDDYVRYDVKRGLRDLNGKGVVAGLTEVSEIVSNQVVGGKTVPCEGQLFYRGYSIEDLVRCSLQEKRFGFEEVAYLLMFGQLPTRRELDDFMDQLASYRTLPKNFVRDVILKAPSADMMNSLAKCVLSIASYDDKTDDISLPNVVRQCMQLIATFPLYSVYSYQAYNYKEGNSLYIHAPSPELSTAENILSLLRADSSYSFWEAHILDICLMLHAEHGGANIKVIRMFEDMKQQVKDWNDEDEIKRYLKALLHGEAFDRAGLIYGMGHAVYSLSDPRANILRSFVETLSREKGRTEEYGLYSRVERLAPQVIGDERRIYKGVSANVDFYSGFVYHMLDLPLELYTPIFAVARIAGWSAHRIEELINMGKIIRPAYCYVGQRQAYVPIDQR